MVYILLEHYKQYILYIGYTCYTIYTLYIFYRKKYTINLIVNTNFTFKDWY